MRILWTHVTEAIHNLRIIFYFLMSTVYFITFRLTWFGVWWHMKVRCICEFKIIWRWVNWIYCVIKGVISDMDVFSSEGVIWYIQLKLINAIIFQRHWINRRLIWDVSALIIPCTRTYARTHACTHAHTDTLILICQGWNSLNVSYLT